MKLIDIFALGFLSLLTFVYKLPQGTASRRSLG